MLDLVLVGKKIHDLRLLNKLNQEELASRLYVSRQAISKWEMGECAPSIDNLIELSHIFNISFEELLCLNEIIDFDNANIFKGHDRNYIMKKIWTNELEVNLSDVFYQFSSNLEQLANKILDSEGNEFKGVTICEVLPFLDDDVVDKMFFKAILNNKKDYIKFLPFVSEEALHTLVVKYFNGEIKNIDIDVIYPFLNEDDIKYIFRKFMEK